MLNLARLESLAQAATPANSAAVLSARELVNMAGEHLMAMREWVFATRASSTLGVTAGQAYVNLPSDFARMVAIDSEANNWLFQLVSYADLLAYKRANITYTQTFATVVWPDQATDTTAPVGARLELYPVPATTAADVIRITYRACWKVLTKPNQVPNIPIYVEPLFVQLLQAFAAGMADGSVSQRVALIRASELFMSVAERDGSQASTAGTISGGAMQMSTVRIGRRWWDRSVNNP
jgi:hypothetical protein